MKAHNLTLESRWHFATVYFPFNLRLFMDYHDEALLALTQCDKLNEIS